MKSVGSIEGVGNSCWLQGPTAAVMLNSRQDGVSSCRSLTAWGIRENLAERQSTIARGLSRSPSAPPSGIGQPSRSRTIPKLCLQHLTQTACLGGYQVLSQRNFQNPLELRRIGKISTHQINTFCTKKCKLTVTHEPTVRRHVKAAL
ncbi:Hypothetical predicted protein [Podarcis lilfordi]|uniref:Uncharacterized protein n=1 Tax=Podarcis lilfordi TaxID=74358 RepID=A0AA35JMT4_9SAUR|nr:Hypothetical predicted protein [Podarcis lilfordi]